MDAHTQAQCQEAQQHLHSAQEPSDTTSAGALDAAVEHFRDPRTRGEHPETQDAYLPRLPRQHGQGMGAQECNAAHTLVP